MDLDKLEKIAKITTAIAIPIVLAVGGWIIQTSSQSSRLSHDYVRLAVEILREDATSDEEALREWAVDLLNAHSDVKLPTDARNSLLSGKTNLPRPSSGESKLNIPNYELPVLHQSKLLQIAVKEINLDIHEMASHNKIGQYFDAVGIKADGLDRDIPWSGAFLSWVIAQTGNPQGITLSAAFYNIWNDALLKGFAFFPVEKKPAPGDLVFFIRGGESPIDIENARQGNSVFRSHGGIIYEVSDNKFTMIAGNVENGIRLREYSFDDARLIGYVRLE
ncbi:DUF2272 domain-containing protein [Nitrosomonas sp.]|uniref:DUF2272 domain-containing protein n=1 Tax=Nitrosomonas sp. TaxID=42353 RepID=UPI001D630746|nr:DUF2272 domain-containing protein [Nitrosomonas sp.]MCB1948377.1 DUF2272 domain-containing protein [Nitrosomonas sp.]